MFLIFIFFVSVFCLIFLFCFSSVGLPEQKVCFQSIFFIILSKSKMNHSPVLIFLFCIRCLSHRRPYKTIFFLSILSILSFPPRHCPLRTMRIVWGGQWLFLMQKNAVTEGGHRFLIHLDLGIGRADVAKHIGLNPSRGEPQQCRRPEKKQPRLQIRHFFFWKRKQNEYGCVDCRQRVHHCTGDDDASTRSWTCIIVIVIYPHFFTDTV